MTDSFWDTVCGMTDVWRPLAIVDVLIVLLTLATLPFLDRGTGSFVVAIVTLVIAGLTLALYGVIRTRCRRRGDVEGGA